MAEEQDFKIYMNKVLMSAENHFSNRKEIPSSCITLSHDVRKMCEQNKCGQYGKNWTCPPAVQSIDAFRREMASYDTCLILYQVYSLKSSFDWKGMMAGSDDFRDRLLALKKELETHLPRVKFMLLGAGVCRLCDPCAYVAGKPCGNPDDALLSMEACGMDVMRLMKENDLKYHNGKNTVTFIGAILYQSSAVQ